MGTTPKIVFVKDLTNARLEEIASLLEKADMGPDYEDSDLGEESINVPQRSRSLQEEISAVGDKLERRNFKQADTGPTGAVEIFSKSAEKEPARVEAIKIHEDFADLEISSNTYDVNRTDLTEEIRKVKRLSERREEHIKEGDKKALTLNTVNIKDLQKILQSKDRAKKAMIARKAKHKGSLFDLDSLKDNDYHEEYQVEREEFEEYEDDPFQK